MCRGESTQSSCGADSSGSAPKDPLAGESVFDEFLSGAQYSPLTPDGLKALETKLPLITKSHSDLTGENKTGGPYPADNIEWTG